MMWTVINTQLLLEKSEKLREKGNEFAEKGKEKGIIIREKGKEIKEKTKQRAKRDNWYTVPNLISTTRNSIVVSFYTVAVT